MQHERAPRYQQEMAENVRKAFRAAYLMTASVSAAEEAVLKAIDQFDPDHDSEEALLREAIAAAVQRPASASQSNRSCDAVEFRTLLALPDVLRRCFVLRFLLRLTPIACARLLDLSVAAVHDYSCAAVRCLAGS